MDGDKHHLWEELPTHAHLLGHPRLVGCSQRHSWHLLPTHHAAPRIHGSLWCVAAWFVVLTLIVWLVTTHTSRVGLGFVWDARPQTRDALLVLLLCRSVLASVCVCCVCLGGGGYC